MAKIQISMIQDRFQVGDIKANADKIIALTNDAYQQGADLVVFPELALVGYPPEDLLHRPGFLAESRAQCKRIAASLPDVDVVFGLPVSQVDLANLSNESLNLEGRLDVLYNAVVWIHNSEIKAIYCKQSLPNYSVFDEVRYFVPGEQSVVIQVKDISFGLLICEDVWQASIVTASITAGAQCLLVMNASPYHINKYDERVTMLKNCVADTGVPVLYTNMVGGQDELVFDGESLAINAQSEVIALGKAFEAQQLAIQYERGNIVCDAKLQRAPESENKMIYTALVNGVRDFIHQNGFSGVVIGLSGGVDSALTLAIAVDALGAKNVHAVMMPSRYTADMSLHDAKQEADCLAVQYDVIEIEPVFKTYLASLESVFAGAAVDVTEENLQARCRGVLLMAISNKSGRMVLTTGNKSEVAVGYATLYGDMCGGFAPLKDVVKPLVYSLCRYRNSIGEQEVIPDRVITRPPTAELREDQLDQDSLPDYAVLDRILELSVEQDVGVEDIVALGIDRETVLQVVTLVQRNEYKRRQSAPGIRVTKRAFGRDRRYPITSGHRRG